jgi:hypothetical protein
MPASTKQSTCHNGLRQNPKDVLATDFGQPTDVFGKFPDRDVFIAGKDSAR